MILSARLLTNSTEQDVGFCFCTCFSSLLRHASRFPGKGSGILQNAEEVGCTCLFSSLTCLQSPLTSTIAFGSPVRRVRDIRNMDRFCTFSNASLFLIITLFSGRFQQSGTSYAQEKILLLLRERFGTVGFFGNYHISVALTEHAFRTNSITGFSLAVLLATVFLECESDPTIFAFIMFI